MGVFRRGKVYYISYMVNGKQRKEAVSENKKMAEQVLDRSIKFWGMAVANLVSLLNPEKIIFGGGIFGPAIQFLDRRYEEAALWAQPISMKQVRLEASSLQGDTGLYGAGYMAIRNMHLL